MFRYFAEKQDILRAFLLNPLYPITQKLWKWQLI